MLHTKEKILALFMTAHWTGNSNSTTRWYFPHECASYDTVKWKAHNLYPRETNERTTHFYIVS